MRRLFCWALLSRPSFCSVCDALVFSKMIVCPITALCCLLSSLTRCVRFFCLCWPRTICCSRHWVFHILHVFHSGSAVWIFDNDAECPVCVEYYLDNVFLQLLADLVRCPFCVWRSRCFQVMFGMWCAVGCSVYLIPGYKPPRIQNNVDNRREESPVVRCKQYIYLMQIHSKRKSVIVVKGNGSESRPTIRSCTLHCIHCYCYSFLITIVICH